MSDDQLSLLIVGVVSMCGGFAAGLAWGWAVFHKVRP
jgi:Na+/glutamate symporter